MNKTLSNTRRRSASASGFTLIELLLVLVILGILITIVAMNFRGRPEKAKLTAANTSIHVLGAAIDMFYVDNGRYPTSEEGLGALLNAPASASNWTGPYIKGDLPVDPWGQPFVYRYPGSVHPNGYDIVSYGPDMREGTDDVTN